MTSKKWFSVREAAAYWDVKTSTLYALLGRRKDRLPKNSVITIGKQIRVDVEKIDQAGGF
jgi:hypothetical protein